MRYIALGCIVVQQHVLSLHSVYSRYLYERLGVASHNVCATFWIVCTTGVPLCVCVTSRPYAFSCLSSSCAAVISAQQSSVIIATIPHTSYHPAAAAAAAAGSAALHPTCSWLHLPPSWRGAVYDFQPSVTSPNTLLLLILSCCTPPTLQSATSPAPLVPCCLVTWVTPGDVEHAC
jgi:hypothetical protein